MSYRSVKKACQLRVSYLSVKQECPHKSVEQACQVRVCQVLKVSRKSFAQ